MMRAAAPRSHHWIVRHRQGIAAKQEPLDRVRRAALLGDWLDQNARVVATIAGESQAETLRRSLAPSGVKPAP